MPKKTRKSQLSRAIRGRAKDIPKRLLQLMGGRTQRGWSRELGIPQQNISRYLSGGTVPHVYFLIHLSQMERVNLNWLVLGEGRMKR